MKIDKIVNFWANKGLSNQYSSTFSSIKFFDYIDNACQIKYLKKILMNHFNRKYLRILDAGAGLGRLTIPLAEAGHYVIALEAADSIYEDLSKKTKSLSNIECLNILIEDYLNKFDHQIFDVIIFSGVLYFYNNNSLSKVIHKSKNILDNSGVIIIRDTFSKNSLIKKSIVDSDIYCYYRPFNFWESIFLKESMKISHKYSCNLQTPLLKKCYNLGIKVFGNSFENRMFTICNLRIIKTISHLYRMTNLEKYFYYNFLQRIWPSMIVVSKIIDQHNNERKDYILRQCR